MEIVYALCNFTISILGILFLPAIVIKLIKRLTVGIGKSL